ncbi:3-oxo-tetronate kinase [Microbacterium lushaniae]|uniref:3-oxo-tetronate kinase n=1 Tax=Microbacterium lushaniae TaxID=2614639 RepID=A0A5J6L064_9MICO|nr:3-oxo-tetronate kinase [Microbacterium lushaniae]QEW01893.1 four-carbon acid sugar kinase family protein [Microbacterium lushaniae]
MSVELGVIADDLTGACDVAAGVHGLGVEAEVRLGVPDAKARPRGRVVIVALKSRTAPVAEAVRDSVESARVLRAWGAGRLYLKYCSTFDSTDEGNIGPVADALLDVLGEDAASAGTPATPAAARTMHRGHLFVGDRLLSESSLAHHPLTPMRDPDIVRVLARQTPRPVAGIPLETLHTGPAPVARRLAELRAQGVRHVLFDAVEDDDLDVAAAAVAGLDDLLLTGAAGFATALARPLATETPDRAPPPEGAGLILSGSGSERTRAQVAAYRGPAHRIDVPALVSDAAAVVAAAVAFIGRAGDTPLITATAEPEEVERLQARWGRDRTAALVEDALARIAVAAVGEVGVRRVLVAGGETSGAVAAALGVAVLRVRRVAAPGVAWTTATDRAGRALDLCLKSGNFGGTDFFDDAWEERG